MRRFIPHILILLIGFICLAVTWYLEPPIQFPMKPRVLMQQTARSGSAYTHHYLRLVSPKKLEPFQELRFTVSWNDNRVEQPSILYAKLTKQALPIAEFAGNQATVTCRNWRDRGQLIAGKGVLARLIFVKDEPGTRIRNRDIRLLNAVGVRADGSEVTLKGLRLVRYKPKHRQGQLKKNKGSRT